MKTSVLALFSVVVCGAMGAGPGDQERTLTVEARDLGTDAPVSGASIKLSLPGGKALEATTGADGIAQIRYAFPEGDRNRYFSVKVEGQGLVRVGADWYHAAKSPVPPERLLFRTEKATAIGGRVVDEEGWPLAGAVVVVSVKKAYAGTAQWVDVRGESIKTDANGEWSLAGVPEQPDSVELATYHHLCLTDRPSHYYQEPFKPLSALRDGSAVVRLRRGTPIEGVVLAPGGHPVAGAEVFPGEVGHGRLGNAIAPVTTDAQGRFRLGIKPKAVVNFGVSAAGFAPLLQRTKVGERPQRVSLTLEPAHSFRGRVVDPAGKPIAQAEVWVYWSGPEASLRSMFDAAVRHRLTTDADGRFEWKGAPGRGVHAHVSAAGFAGKEAGVLASDVDHDVVLVPPTTVRGTVVDRETGQSLPRYSLRLAAAWNPPDPLIWQSTSHLENIARKAPGAFEYTTSSPAHRYLLRVEAEGYLSEDSDPFPTDGATHALSFRLTRAEPIRGVVRNPDGTPARNGFVYVVPPHREGWIDYLSLENDDVEDRARGGTVHAKLHADGRFSLPAQRTDFALLVLADTGSVLVPRRDLRGNDVLSLSRWASVKGTVILDGKRAANIALQSIDPDEAAPLDGVPRLVRRHFVKTDADGRFALPRVMPGRLALAEWVPNGKDRRVWPVIRASLDVEAGRSYDLAIGKSGRRVTGRLALPREEGWMIRKAEVLPKDPRSVRPLPIGVEVLEGGRFRALDLKPGDYRLHIALHEPSPGDSCGWGRLVGKYVQEFTVPAAAGTEPIELGTLEPIEVGGEPLRVGDRAPDFQIKTLDGKDLTLAGFRGKYVLLDFWAGWCAPCVAEMPNLAKVHDEFSGDPRFALIGINLDERPGDAASVVKRLKPTWPQGIADPESPVVSAYGATAIPATFLVGPEGTILARDLRGDKTRAAVAEALKR